MNNVANLVTDYTQLHHVGGGLSTDSERLVDCAFAFDTKSQNVERHTASKFVASATNGFDNAIFRIRLAETLPYRVPSVVMVYVVGYRFRQGGSDFVRGIAFDNFYDAIKYSDSKFKSAQKYFDRFGTH